jgi:hypothetical protein
MRLYDLLEGLKGRVQANAQSYLDAIDKVQDLVINEREEMQALMDNKPPAPAPIVTAPTGPLQTCLKPGGLVQTIRQRLHGMTESFNCTWVADELGKIAPELVAGRKKYFVGTALLDMVQRGELSSFGEGRSRRFRVVKLKTDLTPLPRPGAKEAKEATARPRKNSALPPPNPVELKWRQERSTMKTPALPEDPDDSADAHAD